MGQRDNNKNIRCSIVIATYNGEQYIKPQIESILENIGMDDEIIISDDGSTDNTIAILKSFADTDMRIKVFKGPGKGVKQNFSNGISNAKGNYIFLSDQDDVWEKNKIDRVLEVFNQYNCALVIHNALIVDKNLNSLNFNFFDFRHSREGIAKNIIKNSYVGCCMAFISRMSPYILPIPEHIEMHDQWIGILCEKYGKCYFLDEILIKYRRHENNVSPLKHYCLIKMLKNRVLLIFEFIRRILKCMYT